MSWDAGIFHRRAPENEYGPLGTLAEIRAVIGRVFAGAEWEGNHVVYLPGAFIRLQCKSQRKCEARRWLNPFRDRNADTPEIEELERIARELDKAEVGMEETIMNMSVECRGGGDFVTPLVALCRAGGWSLCDYQSGEFVDLENPAAARETMAGFQHLVEKVSRKGGG